MAVLVPSTVQLVSRAPDGSDVRWIGRAGEVAQTRYSFALRGGADQLSFTLQCDPMNRDPSIAVGRQIKVYAGIMPTWDGQIDEPTPGSDGWQVTAHGAGTFGSQFRATWGTGVWDSGRPAVIISDAIGRGLRWIDHGDLSPLPSGAYLGQAPDNGSLDVAGMLDTICSRGGLTWNVVTSQRGNVLHVMSLPTTVTRLLVATAPIARTLAGVVNAVAVRYQATSTPTYGTAWATSNSLIAKYGRNEQYLDLTSEGTDSGGTNALAVANRVLSRYLQVAWSGGFTVNPGEYLTAKGTPVTLANEQAGEVVRIVGADYGGQFGLGLPSTFIVGNYEYDDDTGTATVTPFGSVRTDWSSLVSAIQLKTTRDDPFGLHG